jgi:iron complex transport system substrate-binding protein
MVMTRRAAILLLAAATCGFAQSGFAQSNAQPKRIVSTASSITELLYDLGLGDRVAGVDRFSTYPPEAKQKPKIGDYISPNLEAIAALKPDLVIIQTNPVRLAERLQALHLKVLEINQENIAALYKSFHDVGEATGTAGQAARLTDSVRAKLAAVRTRTASLPRTRMMFVVGRTPNRLDGLIVVGRASYLNEIIEIAGGENVFHDAVAAYPEVALEEVLARNPEVIADMGDMSDTVSATDQHKREVVGLWQRLTSLAAVKQGRVQAVASDVFTVPGPRIVDAAQAFLQMLHPEAFSGKSK